MQAAEAAAWVRLEERCFSVKQRFLAMYKKAGAGHIGSALSCAELLVLVKFGWMRADDALLVSKGQAAGALYSLLAEAGQLDSEAIESFYADGTRLSALPPVNAIPEIPFATGSLGHGLSLSAGMALGARLKRQPRRVFCVTSDGELDEGSVWEAALFIAHHHLTEVVWLIDRNEVQGIGRTEQVMALEPLAAKLEAFGFYVVTTSGHDFRALCEARDACERAALERPVVIIARTTKGHGMGRLEDTVDSHYLPLDDAQYAAVLAGLSSAHVAALIGYRDAG
jgi:transketolase